MPKVYFCPACLVGYGAVKGEVPPDVCPACQADKPVWSTQGPVKFTENDKKWMASVKIAPN